jgi:hypothetical protein
VGGLPRKLSLLRPVRRSEEHYRKLRARALFIGMRCYRSENIDLFETTDYRAKNRHAFIAQNIVIIAALYASELSTLVGIGLGRM